MNINLIFRPDGTRLIGAAIGQARSGTGDLGIAVEVQKRARIRESIRIRKVQRVPLRRRQGRPKRQKREKNREKTLHERLCHLGEGIVL